MKRQSNKSSSKTTEKKTKFYFNPKDFNFIKMQWKSPKDKVDNEFNINFDPRKFNTIEIEDNH